MVAATKTAWEQGIPLFEALERYSDEIRWREHVNLRHKLFPHILEDLPSPPINLIQSLPPQPPLERSPLHEQVDKLFPPLREDLASPPINLNRPLPPQPLLERSPTEEFGDFLRLHEQLKTALLDQLKHGSLVAVAYIRPRHRGDDPVWVGSDNWDHGLVSWKESELVVGGSHFSEIHIVQPVIPATAAGSVETPITEPVPTTPRRGPGRPTRAAEIRAAYELLKVSRKIDLSASLSSNVPTIQATARRLTGADRSSAEGFEYEAIRRAIGTQFRRDKAEASRSSKSSS